MQEFILVLVVIFVLFKIFGRPNIIYFNQYHQKYNKSQPEVKVNPPKPQKKYDDNDGEYVDFEEIK
ncbi:MAG: hypothetical protein IT238_11905 [Bacteroidia bacterium]|nr:hypothetical protein [Bacteroidia bacterium]MCZ2249619.1 DUF4834 family protein [Bacteroidia bacterium]